MLNQEINLFKYLNKRRIINILKIYSGYLFSKIFGKVLVWGMPFSVSIEPTNLCNLNCPECPSGSGTLTRPRGVMNFTQFKCIIDKMPDEVFYIQLFLQGEPMLNKDLFKMIGYARGKNIYTSVSTNGQFIEKYLNEILLSPPDKLILSIDGIDDETYSSYRKGGSFTRSEKGLQLLVEKKKSGKSKLPFIEFQTIVMKQNEHLLDKIKAYSERNGADKVVFKTMQVSNYRSAIKYLPINNKYSRYYVDKETINIKNKLNNGCFALWRTAVITWDAKVVPCCFDKNADYQIDTLNQKKFIEIWFSENYNAFRKKVMSNRKSVNICNNCTEGMRVNI